MKYSLFHLSDIYNKCTLQCDPQCLIYVRIRIGIRSEMYSNVPYRPLNDRPTNNRNYQIEFVDLRRKKSARMCERS